MFNTPKYIKRMPKLGSLTWDCVHQPWDDGRRSSAARMTPTRACRGWDARNALHRCYHPVHATAQHRLRWRWQQSRTRAQLQFCYAATMGMACSCRPHDDTRGQMPFLFCMPTRTCTSSAHGRSSELPNDASPRKLTTLSTSELRPPLLDNSSGAGSDNH